MCSDLFFFLNGRFEQTLTTSESMRPDENHKIKLLFAFTIVFRSAVSCINFSNLVCIPQYRNSTRHSLYAHINDIFLGVGCVFPLTCHLSSRAALRI